MLKKYNYSDKSKYELSTCHLDLQDVFNIANEITNIKIIEGQRSPERQAELFEQLRTKVKESLHNEYPSEAVDAAPYPIKWPDKMSKDYFKDLARFYHLAGIIKGIAHTLDINIRWGGDWDMDNDFSDQKFDDLLHFERVICTKG